MAGELADRARGERMVTRMHDLEERDCEQRLRIPAEHVLPGGIDAAEATVEARDAKQVVRLIEEALALRLQGGGAQRQSRVEHRQQHRRREEQERRKAD